MKHETRQLSTLAAMMAAALLLTACNWGRPNINGWKSGQPIMDGWTHEMAGEYWLPSVMADQQPQTAEEVANLQKVNVQVNLPVHEENPMPHDGITYRQASTGGFITFHLTPVEGDIGMERRTHLLQHAVSRRHGRLAPEGTHVLRPRQPQDRAGEEPRQRHLQHLQHQAATTARPAQAIRRRTGMERSHHLGLSGWRQSAHLPGQHAGRGLRGGKEALNIENFCGRNTQEEDEYTRKRRNTQEEDGRTKKGGIHIVHDVSPSYLFFDAANFYFSRSSRADLKSPPSCAGASLLDSL